MGLVCSPTFNYHEHEPFMYEYVGEYTRPMDPLVLWAIELRGR